MSIQVVRTVECSCGRVKFETVGEPILTAVCYCDDCQAGGKQLQEEAHAAAVLDEDGGSSYLTYRDDRFACVEGEALLLGFKLKDKAPTKRLVASCCNTGMYLKFAPGHWVSIYRKNFTDRDLPAIEMRTQTRYRNAETPLPDDAPHYKRYPLKLFSRLIGARIAMMLGR